MSLLIDEQHLRDHKGRSPSLPASWPSEASRLQSTEEPTSLNRTPCSSSRLTMPNLLNRWESGIECNSETQKYSQTSWQGHSGKTVTLIFGSIHLRKVLGVKRVLQTGWKSYSTILLVNWNAFSWIETAQNCSKRSFAVASINEGCQWHRDIVNVAVSMHMAICI